MNKLSFFKYDLSYTSCTVYDSTFPNDIVLKTPKQTTIHCNISKIQILVESQFFKIPIHIDLAPTYYGGIDLGDKFIVSALLLGFCPLLFVWKKEV